MQRLNEQNTEITVDNLFIAQGNLNIKKVLKKYGIVNTLTREALSDIIFDVEGDSTPDMFQDIYNQLHDVAFAMFVAEQQAIFTENNALTEQNKVLSKAKAITNAHKAIYRHKYKNREDDIRDAANEINKGDQLLRFFSPNLNGVIGGSTRGFATTVLASSSNGKSTFMTWDSQKKILNNILDEVHVILVEEQKLNFWQRIFANTFKIPIEHLRKGLVKISDSQVEKIEKLYKKRIILHKTNKYNEILELIFSLKCQYIWIDHINAIQYPTENTNVNVGMLLNAEVQYLESLPKNSIKPVIVNLSQVNEKALNQRVGRNVWRHPSYEDAYGSQLLYHHSREYLTLYYPYRDMTQNPAAWTGKQKELARAGKHDFYLKVAKSSFGILSELKFRYEPEFGIFEDTVNEVVTNVKVNLQTDSFNFEKFGV
jgi:hypothetical protein